MPPFQWQGAISGNQMASPRWRDDAINELTDDGRRRHTSSCSRLSRLGVASFARAAIRPLPAPTEEGGGGLFDRERDPFGKIGNPFFALHGMVLRKNKKSHMFYSTKNILGKWWKICNFSAKTGPCVFDFIQGWDGNNSVAALWLSFVQGAVINFIKNLLYTEFPSSNGPDFGGPGAKKK